MDFTDQVHKKAIGICFVVFSILGIVTLLFSSYFMEFVVNMISIEEDVPPEVFWLFEFIEKFIWAIAILFLIPRIILGFGLINNRKWAEMPSMIFAVIGMLNFPLGTGLGIYALLVFTAKPKSDNNNSNYGN
jgi:hypothetical protein